MMVKFIKLNKTTEGFKMMILAEWNWRMNWCKKNGLAPAKESVWILAGEEYQKELKKSKDKKDK